VEKSELFEWANGIRINCFLPFVYSYGFLLILYLAFKELKSEKLKLMFLYLTLMDYITEFIFINTKIPPIHPKETGVFGW